MMTLLIIPLLAIILAFSILTYKFERDNRKAEEEPSSYPLVSVIIPTFNLNRKVESTLKSVKYADYPKKEIIIVADGKKTKPGLRVARKYADKLLIEKKRLGKAKACNLAVKHASGKYILFVDDDTIVEKDAIKKMLSRFKGNAGIVMPKHITRNKNKVITELTNMEELLLQSVNKVSMALEKTSYTTRGCCFMVRRDVYESVGGMEQTLTEDIKFSAMVGEAGYRIIFEPKARVFTEEHETFKSWFKHKRRSAKGMLYVFLSHYKFYLKSPSILLHLLPPLLVSAMIFGMLSLNLLNMLIPLLFLLSMVSLKEALYLLFILLPLLLSSLSPLLFTFTGVNIAQYSVFLSFERKYIRLFLIFPFAFFYIPLVSIAYASGVISGLLDKRRGKRELLFKDW